MTDLTDGDLKRREEEKRERNWDPVQRWQVLMETIAWADSQAAVPRNSRESCLQRQRKHLS